MSKEIFLQRVDKVQRYINSHKEMVEKGDLRQRYHFMGPCGWINDPNGLIFFKGKYHFFYQFNPFSSFWSEMYWGHAISDDLIHWKYLPIALAPSEWYDDHPQGGCFSGSAIEKDGTLCLVYTGCSNNGKGLEQTQNLAYSYDGIHFNKYTGNPVIKHPDEVPRDFFRDPKVWKHNDTYYLLCGAQKAGRAQALLYKSQDLMHWNFFNVMFESRGEWGYMWECPDFYQINEKWVFTCSPMGAGDRKSIYFVGDFDYQTGRFNPIRSGELDWGHDFYAPQSLVDSSGRRIMVGWANEWSWMSFWKDWGPTFRQGWCGFFTIPREVSLLSDFAISTKPIRELERNREISSYSPKIVVGAEDLPIKAGDGVSFQLKFVIDLADTTAREIQLRLRYGNHRFLSCIFDLENARMLVNRSIADGWSTGESHSSLQLVNKKGIDIDILSDRSSIEIFVDNGRIVHSMNVFPSERQNGIIINSKGGNAVLKDVSGYSICLS